MTEFLTKAVSTLQMKDLSIVGSSFDYSECPAHIWKITPLFSDLGKTSGKTVLITPYRISHGKANEINGRFTPVTQNIYRKSLDKVLILSANMQSYARGFTPALYIRAAP